MTDRTYFGRNINTLSYSNSQKKGKEGFKNATMEKCGVKRFRTQIRHDARKTTELFQEFRDQKRN